MRKLAIILIAALLLGVLPGCTDSASGEDQTAGTTQAAGETVTLTFVRIGNDEAEANYWKALIDRFEADNPGIVIEYDDAAIGEAMETKLNTMFSAGMGPDLIGHGIMSVAARAEAGHYQPVTDYFNAWEGRDDLMASVLANGTYKGEIYGLAYSTTPFVFAYRTDLFEAAGLDPGSPPATWEELEETARLLTVRDGDTITQSGFAFPRSAGNFVEFDVFVFGNGGLYYDGEGNPTLDTAEKAEALAFLLGFVKDVSVAYSSTDTNPFVSGAAAMTLINNVALTPMLSNPEYAGKVGIALPPRNTTEATFCGCNMLFVGGDCLHPDEAMRFIEYALSQSEVLARAEQLKIPVTRSSLVDAFIAMDPLNAVRAKCVEKGVGMPRTTWAAAFQTIRNDMVQQALYGEASPEKALADAQRQLEDEISAE